MFTKTNLGNGWFKLSEQSAALAAGGTTSVTSSAITGDMINDLAKAGSYMLQVTIGAGTIVADTHVHGVQDDSTTYQVISSDIIVDQAAGTKLVKVDSGVASPGLKFVTEKDSGGSTAKVTWTVMYWDGGPAMSDMTISGSVGKDPS